MEISKLRKQVISNMKHLGVYRSDFDHTIDVYVDMLHQYQEFQRQFAESGYKVSEQYTNKAGATNDRKTPIYLAMETLRKDLATYSDRLGLNPRVYERMKRLDVPVRKKEPEKPKSRLEQAMSDLNE